MAIRRQRTGSKPRTELVEFCAECGKPVMVPLPTALIVFVCAACAAIAPNKKTRERLKRAIDHAYRVAAQ